jgi:hypothetical protein
MIRAGVDQTLTISPCQMRYLYQGQLDLLTRAQVPDVSASGHS